jgi:hypothetical protein
MIHLHTRQLIDEWRRQRGGADRPPARTRMTAAAFGPLLPQVFVLGLEGGGWRLRLAGGLLHDLFGRELRGEGWGALWDAASRPDAQRALERACAEGRPVVLRARAERDSARWAAVEVGLCPLIGPTDAPDRAIGLVQPVSLLARLEGASAPGLRLVAAGGEEGVPPPPGLRLVVDNTRRVA